MKDLLNDSALTEYLLTSIYIQVSKIVVMFGDQVEEEKLSKDAVQTLKDLVEQEKDLAKKLKKYSEAKKEFEKDPLGSLFK